MQTPFRVMTFNIRHGTLLDGADRWSQRRDLVVDVIRRESPHVLGIQEAGPRQLRQVLAALPSYAAIRGRRYGGLYYAYAPILFSTDRLEALERGSFPVGTNRSCTYAMFSEREFGRRFIVLNSHFHPSDDAARRQSARLVVERWQRWSDAPRIITADLNANESSEPFAILATAGMRDTFSGPLPSFTYHRFRGSRSRGKIGKIDFVLCDERWSVLSSEIVRDERDGRLPSDHYPVTAELALTS